jgi:hypothetical protein
MKLPLLSFLVIAALMAAPERQTFTGVITDSMCPRGDHSQMQMGPTDAECTIACIREHGATFVLYDGTHAYNLIVQRMPENLAGLRVTITGIFDAKTMTIRVNTMGFPAKGTIK